ncbi:GNAT family N-acetyltransferase [Streptomyces misionensis]|uniref:GNAT family N-acetyltransferase n=1 Tax=Streptomyces misionensis TaxID=67331 RepID=UPI00396B99F7
MYQVEAALPSVAEYRALRTAVGWASPDEAVCRRALDTTGFAVVARHGGRAVGMARLIGDGAVYGVVVDVAVHPDHRGAGLGRRMVDALVARATARGIRTTVLVAAPDVVPFYEPLGFVTTPDHVMRHAPGSPT